uniref:RAB5C, member RAS oncogene family n=1 Tax=Pipistrellus kuhlii TaxID=59472 RepID=A0A7J7U800_PIPKU|nr:hypothetical protein mPipKuh1_009182 [Pipistrellus kuhlii]
MAGRGGAARPNGPAAGNKICQFKLVLLGESAVGKSSLVLRFVKGQFHEYQESTIGAAFLTQTVCLDDTTVKFEIWDTAGQERYHSLAPMYYRGAQAAIVVYDITNTVKIFPLLLGPCFWTGSGLISSVVWGCLARVFRLATLQTPGSGVWPGQDASSVPLTFRPCFPRIRSHGPRTG